MARGSFRNKVVANAAQQRNNAASYGHLLIPRGVPIFKEEPDSRVRLDIVPYIVTVSNHPDLDEQSEIAVKGTEWYRRPYKLHRNIGIEKKSVVCPTSIGRKCPICEYRTKLTDDDGLDYKDKRVSALRAGNRNLYYVVPKNEKKLEDRPHLWDISQFLFQDLLINELEEKDEYGIFPDLEEGLTLYIRFSEEVFEKNKFAKASRIDFEKRDYEYDEKEIHDLPSLDDVLIIESYEDIERLFFAEDDGDEKDRDKYGRDTAADVPRTTTRRRTPEPEPEAEAEAKPKPEEDAPRTTRRRTTPERKAEDSEPEAKPEDDREARRAAQRARESEDKKDKGDCPSGYVFGKDCDKHSECEECPVWNDCMTKLEEMQKAA